MFGYALATNQLSFARRWSEVMGLPYEEMETVVQEAKVIEGKGTRVLYNEVILMRKQRT